MALLMNTQDLSDYLGEVFPQISGEYRIEQLREGELTMRLLTGERHLRPGGTISGPAMFALADVSVYALILAHIGKQALAVTTSCSLDFMRKPAAGADLLATCTLLKLGKLLAVGDVLIFSENASEPVARATMTYAIPPKS